MRFIHTSDICRGYVPDRGRMWSAERAEAVRASLSAVLGICVSERADALLIAGNLFGAQPVGAECEEIDEMFRNAAPLNIYITAGDNDYLSPGSPVRTYKWAANVHWFMSGEGEEVPGSRVTIYGLSMTSNRSKNEALKEGTPDAGIPAEDGRAHIFITCCPGYKRGADNYAYTALGGQHTPQILEGGCAAYSGSPEPMSPEDTGEHGVYSGEIGSDGSLTELRFIPVSSVNYIPLTVSVTTATSEEELASVLADEMEKRGRNNIYSITLKGSRDPAADLAAVKFGNDFRIASFCGMTEPQYDFRELFVQHPSDILGLYIQKMNIPAASEPDKKALYYGVEALLRTSGKGGTGKA